MSEGEQEDFQSWEGPYGDYEEEFEKRIAQLANELECIQSQLNQEQRRNKTLQDELKIKSLQIVAIVNNNKIRIEEDEENTLIHQQTIESINNELEKLKKENEVKSQVITTKEEQNRTLRLEKIAQNRLVEGKEEEVKKYYQEVENFKKELDNLKEQIQNNSQELAAKDEKIQGLIQEKDKLIKTKEQNIDELKKNLYKLKRQSQEELAAKDKKIQVLIEEKDRLIEIKEQGVEELNKELEELEKQNEEALAAKDENIEELVQERDVLIKTNEQSVEDLKKELDKLKRQNQEELVAKDKKIQVLIEEKDRLIEIKELSVEELKTGLEELEKQNEEELARKDKKNQLLIQEKDKLIRTREQQVEELEEELEELEKQNEEELAVKDKKIQALMQEIDTIIKSRDQSIEDLKKVLDEVKKQKQEVYSPFKSKGFEQTTLINKEEEKDFYAAIVDVPSILSLVAGWKIFIKDYEEYQKNVKVPGTIVSVLGNYGRGKTYLLGRLINKTMPHSFNISTRGISVVYLKDNKNTQRPVIACDTRGGGLPLKVKPDDLDEDRSLTDAQNQELNAEDYLTQSLRDHGATEDILQGFILDVADVVLIVVGDLTFEDQRLISKITRKYKQYPTKKIIIVHNLFHCETIADVEDKVEESIKTSFNLKKMRFKYDQSDRNEIYYTQYNSYDTETKETTNTYPHLLLAKEHTEAGNYYNDNTITYLLENINTNNNANSINIIDKFYDYLKKNLKSYIQTKPDLRDDDLIEIIRNEEGVPERICHRANENDFSTPSDAKKITMKQNYANEFGDVIVFNDGIETKYSVKKEKHENKSYLVLNIECPEGHQNVLCRVIPMNHEFKIQVKGNKIIHNEDQNIYNNRQKGSFQLETHTMTKDDYNILIDKKPETQYKDGIYRIMFEIKEETNEEWTTL